MTLILTITIREASTANKLGQSNIKSISSQFGKTTKLDRQYKKARKIRVEA